MELGHDDWKVFAEAVEERDMAHATFHLVNLVEEQGQDSRTAEAIETWLGATGSRGSEFLGVGEELRVGEAILLAHFHERHGSVERALHYMMEAMKVDETIKQEAWLRRLASPENLKAMPVDWIIAACQIQDQDYLAEVSDEILERAQRVHDDSRIALNRARQLRMQNHLGEALRVAEEQHAENPDYFACVSLGTNQKENGLYREAMASFEQALEQEPEDYACRLEIGDLHLELAEWEEALRWYSEAEQYTSDRTWTAPSILFAKAKHFNDAQYEGQLKAYADTHPDSGRAHYLLGSGHFYRYAMPFREESILKMVGHWLQSDDVPVRMAISSMEAPSALLACREILRPDLSILFHVPEPDPTLPFKEVRFCLWAFEKEKGNLSLLPIPGVPEPPGLLKELVGDLAQEDYVLETWSEEARATMERHQFGCDAIAAVMVHPPNRPDSVDAVDWRFRVQVAAGLMIARQACEPFWDSPSCEAILSILHGPVDWTSTAAVVALLDVALREPESRERIIETLSELLTRPMTPIWYMCVYRPIVSCLVQIPGISPDLQEALLRERDEADGVD